MGTIINLLLARIPDCTGQLWFGEARRGGDGGHLLSGMGDLNVLAAREARLRPPPPSAVLGRPGAEGAALRASWLTPCVCVFQSSSHKKARAARQKEKRKKRRQELARLRDAGIRNLSSGYEIPPSTAPLPPPLELWPRIGWL